MLKAPRFRLNKTKYVTVNDSVVHAVASFRMLNIFVADKRQSWVRKCWGFCTQMWRIITKALSDFLCIVSLMKQSTIKILTRKMLGECRELRLDRRCTILPKNVVVYVIFFSYTVDTLIKWSKFCRKFNNGSKKVFKCQGNALKSK